jgi:hypothetical protein
MSDADKVRAAADYIERVGLHKGGMWDFLALAHRGVDLPLDRFLTHDELERIREAEVPCCTAGALSVASSSEDEGFRLANRVVRFVGRSTPIGPWNDAPERTKEEVVKTLRAFADSLDAEA